MSWRSSRELALKRTMPRRCLRAARTLTRAAPGYSRPGEHAQSRMGVLVGVLVGYFDEFAVVFAVGTRRGGLVGVEGFKERPGRRV